MPGLNLWNCENKVSKYKKNSWISALFVDNLEIIQKNLENPKSPKNPGENILEAQCALYKPELRNVQFTWSLDLIRDSWILNYSFVTVL